MYGIICPRCGATVDNAEYDYRKGICKECVVESELEETNAIIANNVKNIMEGK